MPTVEIYNRDLKDVAHEESKKQRRAEENRRIRYQFFMFFQGFIKMYILSCCVYTTITYTNVQNPGDNTSQFSAKIRSEITDSMS
jgi:D-alanyl-lipoteichoic acid acyltransferase DltB (MBOAT superfamily)